MTKPTGAARRGRPRTFDEGEVLSKVMNLFWRKGYDATSLDDLSEATGLTRPSLYGAFGNKEALFRRAIQWKEDVFGADMRDALHGSSDLSACLRGFFKVVHRYYTDQQGALGCPVITAPLSSVAANDVLRCDLADSLSRLDILILDRLRKDARYKRRSKRAREDARVIAAMLHSMAIRTRTSAEHFRLKPTLDFIDRLIDEG